MPVTASDDREGMIRELLERRLSAARTGPDPRTPFKRGTGPAPASPAQERLLFLHELDPGTSAYHLMHTLRVEGPLDAAALARALRGVEERHAVLRGVYERRDGVETLVERTASLTLREVALEDTPGALARFQSEEARRPLDPREGPVWHAALGRTHDALHHLVLTAHHIAVDGISLGVLRQELADGYAAELGLRPAPEPPSLRFADHAAAERQRLAEGVYDEQLAYWREHLVEPPPILELPGDHRPPQRGTGPGGVLRARIEAPAAARVRLLARESAATPFIVLLACFQGLLHRCSGRYDFLVGTPVAGRTGPGAGQLIGMFVNTLVLRAGCRPGQSFAELLAAVREDTAGALAHQDVPYERVVNGLRLPRERAGTPLFRVMFSWNPGGGEAMALGGATAVPVPCAVEGTAQFDLTLQVEEAGEAYELAMEFDRELWDEPSAERFLRHFLALTESALADPARPVATLPPLDAEVREYAAQHDADPLPGPTESTGEAVPASDQVARPRDAVAAADDGREPAPGAGVAEAGEPPTDETEETVARVWARVLGVEHVGRRESFFAHGGHSLLAMEAVLALREELGRPLPLRMVFEAPTPASFAARVAETVPVADGDALVEIAEDPRAADTGGLSPEEARIWLADRLDPGTPAYTMPLVCRLRGPVNVAALRKALGALPVLHEALRTSFPADDDGRPVRAIADPAIACLPVRLVDLAGLDARERESRLDSVLAEETGTRFDLAAGPLAQAAVVVLGPEETVLALVLHHIVADGWSLHVLLDDLRASYADACLGLPSASIPDEGQGAGDYAALRNRPVGEGVRAAELAYWRERLTGATAPRLPEDGPRARDQERGRDKADGAARHFVVPPETEARVRELAETEGCTPFMVLLAAYAAVLARYCATDDIALTTHVADRGRPALDRVVGLLLDTAVLRVTVDARSDFRALLRAVRATVLDAQEHRLLPYRQVTDALGLDGAGLTRFAVSMNPPRPARAPFADRVVLEPEAFGEEGGRAELLEHSKADLNVLFEDGGHGLGGLVVHRVSRYGRDRVARLTGHLTTLLDAAVRDPGAPLARLGMLTSAERARLSPGTPHLAVGSGPTCLHELVLDQIARTPDAVALVTDTEEWTYGRLGERVARLARHLADRGVKPGTHVGLVLGRGAAHPVAVLAVLCAGAAYVAVNPAQPPERVRAVLDASDTTLVLTDTPWAAVCANNGRPTVVLGEAQDAIAACDAALPATAGTTDPASLAYLVHTSGSTGLPKAVRTPHAAAAAYLRDYLPRFGLGPGDSVLQLAGPSFDASVRDLLGPLTTGARVVLLDDDRAADPRALLAALARHEVSCVLSVVPTLLRALLTAAHEEGAPVGDRVRLLLTAGEALDLADCARARAVFGGGLEVFNQYGPTEATMTTTSALVCAEPGAHGPAPLGAPVAGARVWLVDRHGGLTPDGVPGEVWIGGERLADGYHGRPATTAERFVPDPFSGMPGARAYRTGDMARREPDGTLTFLGRDDDQVKIRGQRVEPGAVENTLRGLPGVAEAAVVVVAPATPTGDARLVAAVAPATLSADALRTALRGLLPPAHLPSVLHVLPLLPRTPNQKVDRMALAGLPEAAPQRHDAPLTPTERVVATAFTQVLSEGRGRVAPAGRDDDFFDRGGHSLLAARLAARLHHDTGRELSLRQVLDLRTVASIAAWLAEAGPVARVEEPEAVAQPLGVLTPGQEAVWRHCREEPRTAAYHIGFSVSLEGRIDEVALARALDALADRHPALRTRFPAAEGRPEAVVEPRVLLPLSRHDVEGDADPRRRAVDLATADLRAPFDLESGPLARAVLVRCGPREHVLGLTAHHIVADGWTLSVLANDLGALYTDLAAGRVPSLPPAPAFGRYAAERVSWLTTPRAAADEAFWRERLHGTPVSLPLPTDLTRPSRRPLAGAVERFRIEPEVAAGVARLAEEANVTVFVVLLAAFQCWLGRLSGASRFLVAVPVAGRPDAESERAVGPFANIVPVPADLGGRPSFRALVERARETFLDVWEHRELPYERLVAAHCADESRPPLCQAMFAVQNLPAPTQGLASLASTPLPLDRGTCRYELHMRCHETPEGLAGWLEYSTALFRPEAARGRLRDYLAMLTRVVADPDEPAVEN